MYSCFQVTNKNTCVQEHMNTSSPMSDKKLMTGFEKILLFGCLAFLAFTFYKKKDGIDIYEKSEDTIILDGKSSSKTYRELDAAEKRTYTSRDAKTDDIVNELARTFSKGRNENQKMRELGLSEDERKYYKKVKEKNAFDEKIESAKDWWNVLNASAKTYGKVKDIFNQAKGEEVEEENVGKMLEDARAANDFYKNLKNTFNISQEDAKNFTDKGAKAISEWVEFIEKNQKEK